MEYVWNMHGFVYGICLDRAWNIYGLSKEYALNIHGICMEYVWTKYGMCEHEQHSNTFVRVLVSGGSNINETN